MAMALALAVVVVIAIDKPQKRKAYKAQSALLLYLSFTMPYVYTKVNLPNRSCIHTHTLTHKHAVCTIKSPTAHHVSFLYAVLFYFGSNQKIHCCHSKCLCTSLSFSFVLGCSEYDRKCEWVSVCSHFSTFLFMQSVKCLYGFHSLFFFYIVPSRWYRSAHFLHRFCDFEPVYAYFYSILLLPLWQCMVSVVAPFTTDAIHAFGFANAAMNQCWPSSASFFCFSFAFSSANMCVSMWWHFSSFDYSHALLAL